MCPQLLSICDVKIYLMNCTHWTEIDSLKLIPSIKRRPVISSVVISMIVEPRKWALVSTCTYLNCTSYDKPPHRDIDVNSTYMNSSNVSNTRLNSSFCSKYSDEKYLTPKSPIIDVNCFLCSHSAHTTGTCTCLMQIWCFLARASAIGSLRSAMALLCVGSLPQR